MMGRARVGRAAGQRVLFGEGEEEEGEQQRQQQEEEYAAREPAGGS
eukprot:COSAG01_NODE_3693_length_5788_cov_7.398137_6_plen_46_part_00